VFFGYADDVKGEIITLKHARNCFYWSAETKGIMGLAIVGPQKGSKVGKAAPSIDLRKVSAVIECTPAAVEAWESATWA